MTAASEPKANTILAWTAVLGAVLCIGLPISAFSWHLNQTAHALRDSNANLERAVGRRAELEAQLEALQSDAGASMLLVAGASEAVASATVQERIRLITEATGGSLDSARVRPVERIGAFEKITMTVRISSDTAGLAKVLSEIEYGRPAITVEKLAVRSNRNLRRMSNAETTAGTTLIATLDISAWRRP